MLLVFSGHFIASTNHVGLLTLLFFLIMNTGSHHQHHKHHFSFFSPLPSFPSSCSPFLLHPSKGFFTSILRFSFSLLNWFLIFRRHWKWNYFLISFGGVLLLICKSASTFSYVDLCSETSLIFLVLTVLWWS